MIVCLCHRISDRDIVRAVQAGTSTFDDLQEETRVSTACGCCRDHAERTFDKACAERFGCAATVTLQPVGLAPACA